MIFKLELSPQNFHYDVLYPLYSDYICKPKNFSNFNEILSIYKSTYRLTWALFVPHLIVPPFSGQF